MTLQTILKNHHVLYESVLRHFRITNLFYGENEKVQAHLTSLVYVSIVFSIPFCIIRPLLRLVIRNNEKWEVNLSQSLVHYIKYRNFT